ncbi:uncharacterized protein BDR25DRAFT_103055 [Lindgomyces ingoldianus]|uniref:Uncharacterized protein n=1 Tax=Lindgomyces ingoldianus TaxID=673940 RepID=A0ACB6RAD2_9PLEO|nr:uncharacterized protein BDR25DRAFT_103055 [Lindgomyces ingoldianus]KAF2475482.1 hypothetical protein BDR25DRAFT_103055 [Lindgomyces ingoldianus]
MNRFRVLRIIWTLHEERLGEMLCLFYSYVCTLHTTKRVKRKTAAISDNVCVCEVTTGLVQSVAANATFSLQRVGD